MQSARSREDIRGDAKRALGAWIDAPDEHTRAEWYEALQRLVGSTTESARSASAEDLVLVGLGFLSHFRQHRDERSLAEAIARLLSVERDRGTDTVALHEGLAAALAERFALRGDNDDLAEARRHAEHALTRTPTGTLEWAMRALDLALIIVDVYYAHRVPEDLDRALALLEAAEPLVADNSEVRLSLLGYRASCYRTRFDEGGNGLEDLDRALADYRAALVLRPNEEQAMRFGLRLAGSLVARANLVRMTESLDEARLLLTELCRRATSKDDAVQCLISLAETSLKAYELDGRAEHLDATERTLDTVRDAFADTLAADSVVNARAWQVRADAYVKAYFDRGSYPDLEAGISCLQRALALPSLPSKQPGLRSRLASALLFRYDHLRSRADLDAAIDLYGRAMEELGSQGRAVLLNNLGTALLLRYRDSDDRADLEGAIGVLRDGLNSPVSTAERSRNLTNLANALWRLANRLGEYQSLDEAIELLEQAHGLSQVDSLQRLWSTATFIAALGGRWKLSEKSSDLERLEVLITEVLDPAVRPFLEAGDGARQVATALLALNRSLDDRREARVLLAKRRSHLWIARATGDAAAQLGFQRELGKLVVPLAVMLVENADQTVAVPTTTEEVQQVFLLVEATRSMILSEQLSLADMPAPDGVPSELLERERRAREVLRTVDRLEALGRLSDHVADIGEQDSRVSQLNSRVIATSELVQIWRDMESIGGRAAQYASYRSGSVTSLDELTRIVGADSNHDVALASLFVGGSSICLFIERSKQSQLRWTSFPLGEQELENFRRRFMREIPGDPSGTREQTWIAPFQTLFTRASAWLKGVDTVVLSVPGELWSLPLSVVADRSGWSSRERPLSVVVVPTLNLLPRFERSRRPSSETALVVGNPTLDLKYAELEAARIAAHFRVEPLTREAATRAATLDRLERARFIHIAAHGAHNEDDALASGLELHDGVLTAREILQRKISAEIVVMSACESGLLEEIPGQELLGLGQAFLIAGARTVVMSLWRVDDSSTADLMGRFYETYDSTGRAADALARAASAIRSKPGYEHPYFWAPFVVMGDWRAPNRLNA